MSINIDTTRISISNDTVWNRSIEDVYPGVTKDFF